MQVMIFCDRPGHVRGGQRHPEFATYFAGRFSAAELREMIADRHLTVCVGHQLTADQVDDFLSSNNRGEKQGTSVEAAEGKAVSTDAAFLNKLQNDIVEKVTALPVSTAAKRAQRARK